MVWLGLYGIWSYARGRKRPWHVIVEFSSLSYSYNFRTCPGLQCSGMHTTWKGVVSRESGIMTAGHCGPGSQWPGRKPRVSVSGNLDWASPNTHTYKNTRSFVRSL